MENVIDLNAFRTARKPARRPQAPDAPRMFCLSCDTDHFKLYETGAVHCASCGALIRNISYTDNA